MDDLTYIALALALFMLPQLLQRICLPAAITSLGVGAACTLGLGMGELHHDGVVHVLSVLGITTLFLLAGLEVDFATLRANAWTLLVDLLWRTTALAGATWLAQRYLGLPLRPAAIVALALLTPSTGFILDAMPRFGLADAECFEVKTKAIAGELLALIALFACVRSESWTELGTASAAMLAMIVILPLAFRLFASLILPSAPKSEFAFLVLLAVICASVTRKLGVYYLVGAFVAGTIAQRTRDLVPSIVSSRIVGGLECCGSLFVPFYFFHAGLGLQRTDFSVDACAQAGLILAVLLPTRLLVPALYRTLILRKAFVPSLRMSVALMPTLVFTLVLAGTLRERFEIGETLFGALVIYALVTTVIPGFFLRSSSSQRKESISTDLLAGVGTLPSLSGPRAVERPTGAGGRGPS
jgi:Kef-type K+ transport system membrane component KefB